jgi:hypothetical protein
MKKIAIAACLALVSSPAFAVDISQDDKCSYVMSFEGPGSTTLIFSQSQEQFDNGDNVLVIVSNDIWSVKNGDEVGEIKFDGPDAWFSAQAVGLDHGFGLLIDWKYFYDVFDEVSGGVSIIRKGKAIDQLSLTGMYSDVMKLNSCHASRVAAKAERERKQEIERKWSKDPFAGETKPQ